MKTFAQIRPIDTSIDTRYQRDFDEKRARAMSERFDFALFGVPVLSRRENGEHVRIDGQHRIEAAIMADRGLDPVLCEVHDGLSLKDEAAMFLRLNGGRTAIRAFDRYKARLLAGEPVATAIAATLEGLALKVGKSQQARTICAIEALESAFHTEKLVPALRILTDWMDGQPGAYEAPLIRAVSAFLAEYPNLHSADMVSRLRHHTPDRLLARFRAKQGEIFCKAGEAASLVLREIYNERRPKRHRLMPVGYRGDTAVA